MDGLSYRSIARNLKMNVSVLTRWVAADAARSAQVREARIASAKAFADEARQLLEEAKDPFSLSRAKELAHHLRWEASRANPRDYGDKVQTELTGEGGGPVQITDPLRPKITREEWLAAHGVKLA